MGVKISALPPIIAPALSDVFPVSQAGVTYKETGTQLSTLLGTIFATAGANANITSLSGLLTPLSVAQGGTGSTTQTWFTTIAVQAFTVNGTYTPTANMKFCIVEAVGGGGGAGGTNSGGASIYISSCGGGSGGYARVLYTAAQIGASKAVTIGAAGTAGGSGGTGGTGGTTSLGALLSITGGTGSTTGTTTTNGTPGSGGVPTVSTGTAIGISNGHIGGLGTGAGSTSYVGFGGQGASSPFGAGGLGVSAAGNSAGTAGNGYGSGGGGAGNLNGATVGAAGTAGYLVVTEFI